jgi:hypothetical protein
LGVTDFAKNVHKRSWKCHGLHASIEFHHGFSNWDLNTFQEFKQMKGMRHKGKKKQEIHCPEEHGSFFALMQLCP